MHAVAALAAQVEHWSCNCIAHVTSNVLLHINTKAQLVDVTYASLVRIDFNLFDANEGWYWTGPGIQHVHTACETDNYYGVVQHRCDDVTPLPLFLWVALVPTHLQHAQLWHSTQVRAKFRDHKTSRETIWAKAWAARHCALQQSVCNSRNNYSTQLSPVQAVVWWNRTSHKKNQIDHTSSRQYYLREIHLLLQVDARFVDVRANNSIDASGWFVLCSIAPDKDPNDFIMYLASDVSGQAPQPCPDLCTSSFAPLCCTAPSMLLPEPVSSFAPATGMPCSVDPSLRTGSTDTQRLFCVGQFVFTRTVWISCMHWCTTL